MTSDSRSESPTFNAGRRWWCLAAGGIAGLSLFWQTDIGLYTLAAGAVLYAAGWLFLGLPARRPVVFLAAGAGSFLGLCRLAFGPRVHGVRDRVALCEIVERSLRQAALWDEIKDRLDRSALDLSGGQQQRLCIARALAVEPDVLLMDEPASALDPIATAKIEELIHELKTQYTIVIVTHNMQQAARVSDETAYFYLGRLIEVGPTEQIFTNPGRQETEDYVTGRFG